MIVLNGYIEMRDNMNKGNGSFEWSKECPDRYEITLYFSGGDIYEMPKYIKKIICTYVEAENKKLEDYIWEKPKELQKFIDKKKLDNLVDVKINDKTDYMKKTLQRFVDRSVNRYLDKKKENTQEGQMKLPESNGHMGIKNAVVEYLRSIGIETYPEVVFYENASRDYYKWQREQRRNKSYADGIFGYGNVGFGKYEEKYGKQIRVDVAGWISGSNISFDYPIISVEVMKSSNLRDEITNLSTIFSRYSVFVAVVDAMGELSGVINNIPVTSLETFKKEAIKRLKLVREAIIAEKNENEIFNIGKKYNSNKME